MYLFFNVVFQLYILFPAVFNKFATRFIIRIDLLFPFLELVELDYSSVSGVKWSTHVCGTSLNIEFKHLYDPVYDRVWETAASILHAAFSCTNFQINCNISHFFKCLLCLPVHFQWMIIQHCFRIFCTISGVITSFGQPLRCSPWQVVRSRLNSPTQYIAVVNRRADSPRGESSSAFILVTLTSFLQIHRKRPLLIAAKKY